MHSRFTIKCIVLRETLHLVSQQLKMFEPSVGDLLPQPKKDAKQDNCSDTAFALEHLKSIVRPSLSGRASVSQCFRMEGLLSSIAGKSFCERMKQAVEKIHNKCCFKYDLHKGFRLWRFA